MHESTAIQLLFIQNRMRAYAISPYSSGEFPAPHYQNDLGPSSHPMNPGSNPDLGLSSHPIHPGSKKTTPFGVAFLSTYIFPET